MNLRAELIGRGVDIYTIGPGKHVCACMRVHVLKFGYQETAPVHFVSKTSIPSKNFKF